MHKYIHNKLIKLIKFIKFKKYVKINDKNIYKYLTNKNINIINYNNYVKYCDCCWLIKDKNIMLCRYIGSNLMVINLNNINNIKIYYHNYSNSCHKKLYEYRDILNNIVVKYYILQTNYYYNNKNIYIYKCKYENKIEKKKNQYTIIYKNYKKNRIFKEIKEYYYYYNLFYYKNYKIYIKFYVNFIYGYIFVNYKKILHIINKNKLLLI